MRYLLDTNPCIHFLNGTSAILRRRIEAAPEDRLVVCSVVRAELFYGAAKSLNPTRTLEMQERFLACFPSIPFDDAAANIYGVIRAQLERMGTPIGANDLLIASIALANDLTLVTHNTNEFARVPELLIEDWEQES
jgi:tRNA(fMet)-specific endonuclease VapC